MSGMVINHEPPAEWLRAVDSDGVFHTHHRVPAGLSGHGSRRVARRLCRGVIRNRGRVRCGTRPFFVLPLLGAKGDLLAHEAIGTSLATIVATSIRSVQTHAKRGAVDFGILCSWAPWIVGGVGIGVRVADRVPGSVLAIIFGTGVAITSFHFLFPIFANRQLATAMPGGYTRASIAFSLGAFSSLLGIGGGTIAIIVMTLCGNSIHRAIATAAGVGVIIAIPGMIGFMAIGLNEPNLPFGSIGYVNFPAALAITSTSVISAPWGAALTHKLDPNLLKKIFGLYLLFVAYTMISKGLAHP